MCDMKKSFASWVAALAVHVESHPLCHLLRSLARNSEALLSCLYSLDIKNSEDDVRTSFPILFGFYLSKSGERW